jgi:hypothetical protein
MTKSKKQQESELFQQIKSGFLDYDPAFYIQNNLTLDGTEFRIIGNGWKFMADIYRYIGLQAPQKNGKPVVIKKGRQVGATMMAGALDLYFTNSGLFTKPAIRVAHLFPALAHVKKFSQDKLEGMIRTAKNDVINKNKLKSQNAVDNVTMKQFETGTLWIDALGADGDRLRGMTIDVAFYDEIQDAYPQAVNNVGKTLTAAKYGRAGSGIQVFFGTPKERGTFFNIIWDQSDQRYYHLGCVGCGETYPFYLPEDDRWKKIWIYGNIIKCPLCGVEQTKVEAVERGKWVASKNFEDCKYVGFHINQLYVPNLTKEFILDQMPENNPAQSERVWNNEVIGEFYSGAGLPLTRQDIYDKCRDAERHFAKRISDRDKPVYLGVDWGGKSEGDEIERGQSFSCVVILSADHHGNLYIEHTHKLRDQSFNYKKETIHEMYRRFGVRRGVSDWFFGQDVVHDLQLSYGEKFLGAQGSGNLLKPLKFREDELIIAYNKDLLIEELFDLLRKGKIKFPWKSYEHIEWLVEHCTSMEMTVKTINGQPVKHYVKGSTPNDGLMALMYAYMAYKFDLTKGFTVKPGIDKPTTLPKPALAYAPRLR